MSATTAALGIGGNLLKAIPGVGTAVSLGAAAMGVGQLIKDIMAKGPDPAKLEAISKARDARAEQIMGATPNMSRQAAMDAANEELKPFMDQASQGEASGMDIAQDAINVVGMGVMAKRGGLRMGKKTNANAPTTGGPATGPEPVNGTTTMGKKPMMDEPEMVHNATEERMETGLAEAPQHNKGFSMGERLPELTGNVLNGTLDPISTQELQRMAMLAKIRSMRQAPPGAFRSRPLGIESDPESGRNYDLQRIAGGMYGRNGD